MEVGDLYNAEADALEDDPDLWGGQFSMLVFSKMRGVKVLVHDTSDLNHILYDNTYPEIPSTAVEVHVAYNGRDHYDAVEIANDNNDDSSAPNSAKRMRTSAEATPPCSTQEMVVDEGAKREKQSNKREADAEAGIKATPSKRTRVFAVKPPPKSAQPIAKKPAAAPPVPKPVCKRVPAPMRRRCRPQSSSPASLQAHYLRRSLQSRAAVPL